MKIKFAFFIQFVCIFLLMAGCARLKPAVKPAVPSGRESFRLPATGNVEIVTQYAYSTEPRIGYNTFEAYIENHTTNTITFKSATLNGVTLSVSAADLPKALRSISFDGEEIFLGSYEKPVDQEVTWFQFYPSAVAGPGETVVFQLNFKHVLTSQKKLVLRDEAGKEWQVTVPRFRQPDKLITAVTYPLDYGQVYVQYKSGSAPERLQLNDWEIKGFRRLTSVEGGMAPEVLATKSPFSIRTGLPIYVKIRFADGKERCALVRALNGIGLHACPAGPKSEAGLRELGLDVDPSVLMLPVDFACADFRAKDKGLSAMPAASARLKEYLAQPGKLGGLAFCTADFPEVWNIYGTLGDAGYEKTYRLGWGRKRLLFIEEEERNMERLQFTSAPRPWLWVPDRFQIEGRALSAEEMKLTGWMVMARGGKGIRYHFWMNSKLDPFAKIPDLLPAMKELNEEIGKQRGILSPLVLASERVRELGAPLKGRIKIYTGWSGEQGLLVMVRNLDYKVDLHPKDTKGLPFEPTVKNNLAVRIALPEWFKAGEAEDLLTNKRIKGQITTGEQGRKEMQINLDELKAYRLIWIPNS